MHDMSGDFLAAARRRFERATKQRAACRQQANFNILLKAGLVPAIVFAAPPGTAACRTSRDCGRKMPR
jgi:hypothetical protein